MTDAIKRQAERRAKSDSSPLARGSLLKERLRSGALLEFKLRLAGFCGDASALAALGLEPERPNPLRAIVAEHALPEMYEREWRKWVGHFAGYVSNGAYDKSDDKRYLGYDAEAARDAVLHAVLAAASVTADSRDERTCVELAQSWVDEHPYTRDQARAMLCAHLSDGPVWVRTLVTLMTYEALTPTGPALLGVLAACLAEIPDPPACGFLALRQAVERALIDWALSNQ